MPDVLDRLGAALLDASLAAIVITGLVILVMVQCRQPARRLKWARAGLLSTLALIPLAGLNPVPRIDLRGSIRQLLPTGLDEPSPYPEPQSEGSSHRGLAQGFVGLELRPRPQPRARPLGASRWSRWVGRGLVVAYGAGVSLGLGSILLGLCGSAWLIGEAERHRSPRSTIIGRSTSRGEPRDPDCWSRSGRRGQS